MNTPLPSASNAEFTWNQGLAYIIGTPTLVLTPLVYWQYGSSIFGSSGLETMFIIMVVGGTLSFALFAGRQRWLIGSLLGLSAGVGAAGMHLLYTTMFQRETMHGKESALVCLAGAAIPMALLAYILNKDRAITNEKAGG